MNNYSVDDYRVFLKNVVTAIHLYCYIDCKHNTFLTRDVSKLCGMNPVFVGRNILPILRSYGLIRVFNSNSRRTRYIVGFSENELDNVIGVVDSYGRK